MCENDDEGSETLRTDGKPDPGWIRIGKTCTAGRRSLWIKWEEEDVSGAKIKRVAFTLRAGREGDDSIVRVTRDNPQWRDLEDVLSTAQFAAET